MYFKNVVLGSGCWFLDARSTHFNQGPVPSQHAHTRFSNLEWPSNGRRQVAVGGESFCGLGYCRWSTEAGVCWSRLPRYGTGRRVSSCHSLVHPPGLVEGFPATKKTRQKGGRRHATSASDRPEAGIWTRPGVRLRRVCRRCGAEEVGGTWTRRKLMRCETRQACDNCSGALQVPAWQSGKQFAANGTLALPRCCVGLAALQGEGRRRIVLISRRRNLVMAGILWVNYPVISVLCGAECLFCLFSGCCRGRCCAVLCCASLTRGTSCSHHQGVGKRSPCCCGSAS